MLGLSAAVFGTWVDRNGPRAAMFTAAVFWSTGFLVGSLGIATGQLWLVYLGYGVIGGIGLGIGYISPVSTLIKWFPDRPGPGHRHGDHGLRRRRADRLAAVPPADGLLRPRLQPRRHGLGAGGSAVALLFLTLGLVYLVFMLFGAFIVRVPADGWKPAGFDPSTVKKKSLVTTENVSACNSIKTPQFWLLWIVLFCNVTAGHRHPRAGRADDPGLLPRRDDAPPSPPPPPPASSACCRCSTWAAGSCGPRRRTTSAASRST